MNDIRGGKVRKWNYSYEADTIGKLAKNAHITHTQLKVNLTCKVCQNGQNHQNRYTKNLQNRRTILPPIPIDAESRAVSKTVLTLDVAQKAKKGGRFDFFFSGGLT